MELHSMGPPLPGEPTHRTRSIILWQDGSEHATDLVLPSRVHLLRDGSPARQQQAVCAIAEVGLLPEVSSPSGIIAELRTRGECVSCTPQATRTVGS